MWKPASNGQKRFRWFVMCNPWKALTKRNGQVRWFASLESAQEAANIANQLTLPLEVAA